LGAGPGRVVSVVGRSAGRFGRYLPARLRQVAPLALAAVAILLIVRASGGHLQHTAGTTGDVPVAAAHHHGM